MWTALWVVDNFSIPLLESRPRNTCHCSSFAVINVPFFTLSTRQINSSHPSNTSFVGSGPFLNTVSDLITLTLDLKKHFSHNVLLISKIWSVVSQPPMAWTLFSPKEHYRLAAASQCDVLDHFLLWLMCYLSVFQSLNLPILWHLCPLHYNMYIISCFMYPSSIKNKKSVCFFLTTIQIYNIFCGLI